MNQSLIPDSECQRSIENIPSPTLTVLLFGGNMYNSNGNYSNAVANKFEEVIRKRCATSFKDDKYTLYR